MPVDKNDPRLEPLALRLWRRWSVTLTGKELDFEKTPQHLRAPVFEMADEVLKWHDEQHPQQV